MINKYFNGREDVVVYRNEYYTKKEIRIKEYVVLDGCTFDDVDFSMLYLKNCIFDNCKFMNCTFDDTVFFNNKASICIFNRCVFDTCDLSQLEREDYIDEIGIFEYCKFINTLVREEQCNFTCCYFKGEKQAKRILPHFKKIKEDKKQLSKEKQEEIDLLKRKIDDNVIYVRHLMDCMYSSLYDQDINRLNKVRTLLLESQELKEKINIIDPNLNSFESLYL